MSKLKPSLAGFNTSPRANRTNPELFVKSYLYAFPDRRAELEAQLSQLHPWLEKMLGKGKKPYVPRSQYIPDRPNPRYGYKREATNIARKMRQHLDSLNDGIIKL